MSEKNVFQVRKPARITDIPAAQPAKASENFKGKKVGMTFNVPPEWHKKFKMAAIQEGFPSMHELLYLCFDLYLKDKGKGKGPE